MADISLDLRRRIVSAYRDGLTETYEATAEMFKVSRASVSRLLRRDRETGDVLPKKRGGDLRRSVDLAWIEKHAEDFPDARLVDRIESWQAHSGRRVSIGSMWNALDAIGWTHKKTPVAVERDRPEVQVKRNDFVASQQRLEVGRLIFLDESGFRLGSPLRYGWAPRGQDSPGKTVEGQWETMTMIGALALDGFRGFMTVDAGTSAEVFRAFVEQQLVPNLRTDDLVVMDNLSAHRDSETLAAIRRCGAEVLFLPPYSPEFNPIEKAWGKIKAVLARHPDPRRL